MDRVISVERPELVELFAGVPPRAFDRLVAIVARRSGRQVADGSNGRQWSLPLADRELLVATYYRTNLTMRQRAPLFGVKTAAVGRIVYRLGPFLALAPTRRRYGPDMVLIVDGTLVPTRDTAVAASSKNYRMSVNMRVLIEADTWLVVAVGQPTPGNPNDCTAWAESKVHRAGDRATVLADGGYQGTGLVMPHRRKPSQARLPDWKEDRNTWSEHASNTPSPRRSTGRSSATDAAWVTGCTGPPPEWPTYAASHSPPDRHPAHTPTPQNSYETRSRGCVKRLALAPFQW